MKIVEQHASVILPLSKENGIISMKIIEYAGRNCYASQDKITKDSYRRFIKSLIKRGHEAPLEFADITFDITTSRAVMAEMTRHRLASFCIESQRYIKQAKSGDIAFIRPEWAIEMSEVPDKTDETYLDKLALVRATEEWRGNMLLAEDAYCSSLEEGLKPEEAREMLPNSTATRMIVKANVREWRHFFKLRCAKSAYPQMRELATSMLLQAATFMPEVFEDIVEDLDILGQREE